MQLEKNVYWKRKKECCNPFVLGREHQFAHNSVLLWHVQKTPFKLIRLAGPRILHRREHVIVQQERNEGPRATSFRPARSHVLWRGLRHASRSFGHHSRNACSRPQKMGLISARRTLALAPVSKLLSRDQFCYRPSLRPDCNAPILCEVYHSGLSEASCGTPCSGRQKMGLSSARRTLALTSASCPVRIRFCNRSSPGRGCNAPMTCKVLSARTYHGIARIVVTGCTKSAGFSRRLKQPLETDQVERNLNTCRANGSYVGFFATGMYVRNSCGLSPNALQWITLRTAVAFAARTKGSGDDAMASSTKDYAKRQPNDPLRRHTTPTVNEKVPKCDVITEYASYRSRRWLSNPG